MGKTRNPASIPHAGIKHNTSSARTHAHSSRGFDWFWLLLALVAVLAIFLADSAASAKEGKILDPHEASAAHPNRGAD